MHKDKEQPAALFQQRNFRVETHLFMMCFPISVEPVKPSLRTSGWSDRRCPTRAPGGRIMIHFLIVKSLRIIISFVGSCHSYSFLPDPGRILMTPLGSPALAANSANFSAVSGVTWKHTQGCSNQLDHQVYEDWSRNDLCYWLNDHHHVR